MNKETLKEMLEKSSPKDLRVINYVFFVQKKHSCNASTITYCTSCNFKGCKDCYLLHAREKHPTTLGFLERTATTNLVAWQQPEEERGERQVFPQVKATSKGRIKCPCDEKFRGEAHHNAHMIKHHKGVTLEKVAMQLTPPCRKRHVEHSNNSSTITQAIDLLSLEEIEMLLREIKRNE